MSKLAYAKPVVVKMGSVTEKTEGGIFVVVLEIMSYRGRSGGS
jgi:hypothetical protein